MTTTIMISMRVKPARLDEPRSTPETEQIEELEAARAPPKKLFRSIMLPLGLVGSVVRNPRQAPAWGSFANPLQTHELTIEDGAERQERGPLREAVFRENTFVINQPKPGWFGKQNEPGSHRARLLVLHGCFNAA